MKFIDLFSGCGGLSLGLLAAGWDGFFAIEKSKDAFSSFKHNLINGKHHTFNWPDWLPIEPYTTKKLLNKYSPQLEKLRNKVDLVAGGPPCQGYSFAGRRKINDPRNKLFLEYLEVIKLIQPRFLMFENVRGFKVGFTRSGKNKKRTTPHNELITIGLENLGYTVYSKILLSSTVGVPQPRRRFVLVAIKKDDSALKKIGGENFFNIFHEKVLSFREKKGIPKEGDITAKMALYDLETNGKELIPCNDSSISGFKQLKYKSPDLTTEYLSAIRNGMEPSESPNSMRIARHKIETIKRFQQILNTCRRGFVLSSKERECFNLRKHSITPLAPDKLAATVTTLPDDIIHYSEPRILTVRETARLQSFPDWFDFQGPYTTGGKKRREECPRYSQVGNAVPPFLAEALGQTLSEIA